MWGEEDGQPDPLFVSDSLFSHLCFGNGSYRLTTQGQRAVIFFF